MTERPGPDDASDPRSSAWVSANAGAGKTHLLANRVTRLLLDGADPSRILCLTYTKAAAAEMSKRLFDRLGEWALLSDHALRQRVAEIGAAVPDHETLGVARRLFARALETPGGLKVQTIHSFCQHVLARFPVEARIPARFSVLDERSAAELMRQARIAILERASRGDPILADAIAVLAIRAADTRFADLINMVIGRSGRLRDILSRHNNDRGQLFARLRHELDVEPGEDEFSALQTLCAELRQEREQLERVAEWLSAGSINDRKLGHLLGAFLTDIGVENVARLRDVFFTGNDQPRKNLATKATAKSAPDLMATFEQLNARMAAAEERRKGAATASLTEALVEVAGEVLAEYDRRKRSAAALDYDDLIRSTLSLLEGRDAAAWVLYKLDGGLDHILVDEAQDTSPEQWRIVAKLAEEFFAGIGTDRNATPRTLFAVGDEKQSIFSFQGAAPEEFGNNLALFRSRVEAANLAFADVRRAVSRRSAQAILTYVDEVFADPLISDGLTSTGNAVRHDPFRADIGRVEIWPTIKPPDRAERDPWERPVDAPPAHGAYVTLASRIATRIADWLREGISLPGTDRPVEAGDIMILVRRRNAFTQEMIRQLMDRGVPVAGADRMVLLDQIAISDLVALGRFVLFPGDDLNLAALLKSPFVGFDEDDLYALAQPRPAGLWEALRARAEEQPIFERATKFLTLALAGADYLPPFEFYAQILSHGARKAILARLGKEADDAIDEFLSLARIYESSHAPSLEGFLAWFAGGASEVKRDMEQGGGAVRVMTVHGAKGLEANIVIVPDTTQAPDHERRAGILYTEDCLFYGVSKSLETRAVAAAKAAAHSREMREYRRLLYVALTRARDWLILCGYETRHGVQAQSWYPALEQAGKKIGHVETDQAGNTILVHGLALTGRDRATSPSSAASSMPTTSSLSAVGEDIALLPDFLSRAPAGTETPPRIIRPSDIADMPESGLLSPVAGGNGERFRRGLLIHALLAALPEVASSKREATALRYLIRRGMDADDAQKMFEETRLVLEHPAFAPLFGPESRGEIAITAELPEFGIGARIHGQIDRLAVLGDRILIADFKTNRPPPVEPEQTPKIYLRQMALYRAGVAKLYPGRTIACALIWTDGARLMTLPDSLLDLEIMALTHHKAAIGPA